MLRRCRSPKAKAAEEYKYTLPVNRRQSAFRPVVVGFGPAGMFAGLILAEAGLRPIVLERGKDIQRRQQDVNAFGSSIFSTRRAMCSSARAVPVLFLTAS